MPRGIYQRKPNIKYGTTGQHHSKEAKIKIGLANSISQKGMKKPWVSKARKGKVLSMKTKRKIGEGNIKRYKENPLLKIQIGDKLRGEKSPLWKGGITKRTLSDRKYKEWRMAVFMRDNFTCQFCGVRNHIGLGESVYLEAHHIKSWAKYPKLRYKIENGITLCGKCHNLTKGRQ